jgi:ParB/RepB/Spo0J family partition protein
MSRLPARLALRLRPAPARSEPLSTRGDLLWIPAELLQPDPEQPRKEFPEDTLAELVESITDVGILTPLRVRPPDGSTGAHVITDGERRWRAGQRAGVVEFPCLVEAADTPRAFFEAYSANLHRDALSPVDAAVGLQHIRESLHLVRDEEAAEKLHKSVGWVRQMNAVLALDPKTRQTLRDRDEPVAVAVGLRPQSAAERTETLDAIAELPSRDTKVSFVTGVNSRRRAGMDIKSAIASTKAATPSVKTGGRRSSAAGRPTRISRPFRWRPVGNGLEVDVNPAALRTTALASNTAARSWQWRDAIRDDVIAFRDSCADTPGSSKEWSDLVEVLLPLLSPEPESAP